MKGLNDNRILIYVELSFMSYSIEEAYILVCFFFHRAIICLHEVFNIISCMYCINDLYGIFWSFWNFVIFGLHLLSLYGQVLTSIEKRKSA